MIECIKTGKKPVYEVECFECHSLLRYAMADVILMHITCPVCGCSIMVYYDRVDDTESTVTEASGTTGTGPITGFVGTGTGPITGFVGNGTEASE